MKTFYGNIFELMVVDKNLPTDMKMPSASLNPKLFVHIFKNILLNTSDFRDKNGLPKYNSVIDRTSKLI